MNHFLPGKIKQKEIEHSSSDTTYLQEGVYDVIKEDCDYLCKDLPKPVIIPSGICKTGYLCEFKEDGCHINYITQNIKECTDMLQPESCVWNEKIKTCE